MPVTSCILASCGKSGESILIAYGESVTLCPKHRDMVPALKDGLPALYSRAASAQSPEQVESVVVDLTTRVVALTLRVQALEVALASAIALVGDTAGRDALSRARIAALEAVLALGSESPVS